MRAITDRTIENRWFTYASTYRIEDRTLKIRREFVSRVPRQVCGPEVEAEIVRPMKVVAADVAARMRFAAVTSSTVPDQPVDVKASSKEQTSGPVPAED